MKRVTGLTDEQVNAIFDFAKTSSWADFSSFSQAVDDLGRTGLTTSLSPGNFQRLTAFGFFNATDRTLWYYAIQHYLIAGRNGVGAEPE